MGIDFRGIRMRLRSRLDLLRLRATLALVNLLQAATVKLAPQPLKEKFVAEIETHDQETGEKWKSLHRQALFTNVGLALSQWSGMEDLLVGITSLLLRTYEANKVGVILYSIVNFNVWLGIIEELFLLEPLYTPLKPRWNKLSGRLRSLKETRDRLAHHTIYYGNKATTLAGDTTLRPAQFDIRQKSQKYQPLNHDQISEFIDSVSKAADDLRALLESMTALLNEETSRKF
jgi:hypothetical protein